MKGRFISYFYRYDENDEKGNNIGFVKVLRMSHGSDKCRLYICIRDDGEKQHTGCKIYLFDEGMRLKELGSMFMVSGVGDVSFDVSWNNVVKDGRNLSRFMGILIVGNETVFYATTWMDEDVKPKSMYHYYLEAMEYSEGYRKSENSENADDGSEKCVEADDEEEVLEENPCERLISEREEMTYFDEKRFLRCVKITPQDIGTMEKSNWTLGLNSFLSHGYEEYDHLLLGKIEFGRNDIRYVLGVPGVFTNKDKYLATMFGFTVFVPVKKLRVMTGSFGYWIIELRK